jgi:hypothetical protein
MPPNEHLVLCGGATTRQGGDAGRINLNLHGPSANVRLEIEDISRRLLANVSDVHADLLEVASYVYAADGAIPRGGKTDPQLGARWRRKLRFVIPVRQPQLWSSDPVIEALVETIRLSACTVCSARAILRYKQSVCLDDQVRDHRANNAKWLR